MFDVARIEAQKVACQPQHVSVRDLFNSLDQEFALACSEKGLRWSVRPTDDWLWTDAVLAQRMLRNLLENAVRYTQHGEVRLRARRRGGLVHCQVWDTGMGISRVDQSKVFNDYFQVQNTARRAQDGLGLGLGVVRRLVTLTGTRVALHSRLGQGSCFDIAFEPGQTQPSLPLGAALPRDVAMTLGAHDCVLVIEDQATVLDAVVTVLQHSGYRTLGGESAMALVRQAAEQELWPCAVICDYRLSHSYNGFDAIAELRHELGDELPAILVTGDLDPQIQARAAEQGIRALHKPLDQAQLLQALHQATTRSG
jgi:CheY-like chemotaxis protein